MNQRKIISILVSVFSAGWLVPLWFGVEAYLSFQKYEVWPRLAGQHPLNSFPFLDFASNCFLVAFLWLGLAIVFWAYFALGRYRAA